MKIIGYIAIEEGLPLKSNCLNQSIDIKINQFEGRLLSPKLPDTFFEDSEKLGILLIEPESDINFNESIEWGQPFSWPHGESNVTRFKIEIDVNDDINVDRIKEELSNETAKWIRRFKENFFAYNYHVGVPHYEVKNRNTEDFDYYLKKTNGSKVERITSRKMQMVKIFNVVSLDITVLKEVVKATSSEKNLSPEYQLLKEAHKALRTQEYRKSILDSATALELCLTNILKKNLKVADNHLLIEILKTNNSISKKRNLLKHTKFQLPEYNYQKKVEDVRNRAIHVGINPSDDEAKNAYEIVAQALEGLIENKLI
ncbi:MAG: hypothetical protein K0M40_19635 [Prolixibacteraceae bacterium]|nr:hypothetical protein [Prolixibacteraceae bacterium]